MRAMDFEGIEKDIRSRWELKVAHDIQKALVLGEPVKKKEPMKGKREKKKRDEIVRACISFKCALT